MPPWVHHPDITQAVLPIELFEDRKGGDFSIRAHVATDLERAPTMPWRNPTLTVERICVRRDSAAGLRGFRVRPGRIGLGRLAARGAGALGIGLMSSAATVECLGAA